MAIRHAQPGDYETIAGLYKDFFTVHNIFQGERGRIVAYLDETHNRHPLLVCDEEDSITGALFLVRKGTKDQSSHLRWKFRHFAFVDEAAAQSLLEAAEEEVKEASATAKIEITIAENEPALDFYKANGYEQEGALTNHFRWGETCYILSKSFDK